MTKEEFFSNNNDSKFIDRMSSILNISTDRLRIVGFKDLNTGGGARRLLNNIGGEVELAVITVT